MGADEQTELLAARKKGGNARRDALSPEQRKEIAQKAADARWNLPRATHEGILKIGDAEIPCAVLEDGTRLLSRIGFIRAIGRTGKARGGRTYDKEFQIPVFLAADNLNPFITNELTEDSKPLRFRPLKGGPVIGYRADLLPRVCDVFLDARIAKALRPNQIHIAEACRILQRGFARVGIAALIDSATGFEQVRDKDALQAILQRHLGEELARWAKRFPDDFYHEMYRLKNWTRKNGGTQRTHAAARYTNDLVYSRITPGLLAALRRLTPPNDRGRKPHYHRWLSEDVGQPALKEHFVALLALMRGARTWDELKGSVNRALPIVSYDLGPLFNSVSSTTVLALPPGRSEPDGQE